MYVCDGTRVLRAHATAELEALAALGRPLVVLTDPDERGRQLRGHLDSVLAPALAARDPPGPALLHAFVPEASAMSVLAGPVHAAGNRGIEHAVPKVLVTALRGAAPSHGGARAVWDLRRLQELRLARPFDGGGVIGRGGGGGGDDDDDDEGEEDGSSTAVAGPGEGGSDYERTTCPGDEPRARRRRLCALLGLGRCTGSQLAAALNQYFSEERVAAALAALEERPAAAVGGD